MAEVQKGAAVIFGTGVSATVGIIWDNTVAFNQSEDFSREADMAEVRDNNGACAGKVYHNKRRSFTISVVPADNDGAATIAGGATNSDLFLVPPGTVVAILDPNSGDGVTQSTGITDGLFPDALNGDASQYLLEACSRRTTNTGEAVVDITLVQCDDNDISVAVA